jgi:hypothetical protein
MSQPLFPPHSQTDKHDSDLSDFTAKVAGAVNSIIIIDNFAVKALESIRQREQRQPTLSTRLLHALSPFSALNAYSAYKNEEELRRVFIKMTSAMSANILPLIEQAGHILHGLRQFTETLSSIRKISYEEDISKDMAEWQVLAELWGKLARPDDYVEFKRHKDLLRDVTEYHANAIQVVQTTLDALKQMKADLHVFRGLHVSPALVWQDFPLEVHIEHIRKGMERLKRGKSKMDEIDPVEEEIVTQTATRVT